MWARCLCLGRGQSCTDMTTPVDRLGEAASHCGGFYADVRRAHKYTYSKGERDTWIIAIYESPT